MYGFSFYLKVSAGLFNFLFCSKQNFLSFPEYFEGEFLLTKCTGTFEYVSKIEKEKARISPSPDKATKASTYLRLQKIVMIQHCC